MTYISGGTLSGVLRFGAPANTPAVAPAGTGRIYYDAGLNKFRMSEDGGAYVDLGGSGAESLAQTLAVGNTTGGTNIVVSTGDEIVGAAELTMRGGSGGTRVGVNSTDYWFIDSFGNTDFTTEPFGGIGITGGQFGLNLGTSPMPDDYPGGFSVYCGNITAGTSSAGAGWIDIQAGSCTGGTGEGGWVQIGAGSGRSQQGGFFQMWAGSVSDGSGSGGFFQINAGDGGWGGGSGGYLGLFGGSAQGGTQNGGDVLIDAGSSVGGLAGAINIGGNARAVNINSPLNNPQGGQIGTVSDGFGLIQVQRGFTSIGDNSVAAGLTFGPLYYDTKNGQYVRFGNSVYVDGSGVNNVIRAGDGGDIQTVFPHQVTTDNTTYNLASAGAIAPSGSLVPGSVVIRVILNNGTVYSTVTDNGAGNFASGAVLPSGGTVDYAARTLTGTTAGLERGTRVEIAYVLANTAGETLTVRSGSGNGTANGGSLSIRSGAGGGTSGNSGNVLIDAGAVTSGTTGAVSIGGTNASVVELGRSGVTTTVAGTFDATGSTNLGAIGTVSSNTTLDATQSNVLVDATSGGVTISLPPAAGSTRRCYTIKKIDSSVNSVTIDGDGAETIDGQTTVSLAVQYETIRIVCNGTAWFIM